MSLLLALAMAATPFARLIAVHDLPSFPSEPGTAVVFERRLEPGMPWNEAIVSWNVQPAEGATVDLELRAEFEGRPTAWYRLGSWNLDGTRGSVDGQKDADGSVATDTLNLVHPAHSAVLRTTLRRSGPVLPKLGLLTVAFSAPTKSLAEGPNALPISVPPIPVPLKSQGDYPRGGVLCSPTAVSMVLGYWARHLARPEWVREVPEIEAKVWDPVYKGAGNWSFNMAFAGSLPGMRAYVARFGSIGDLERLVDSGIPVVCSVSFDLIRGKPLSASESGHLVVLVGFDAIGDPVFNDPAYRGEDVRRIYRRADFERAWAYSRRTAYMVVPSEIPLPADPDGLWTP